MRKRVTLHPETVQKAAELAAERVTRERKKRTRTPEAAKSSPVHRTKVNPKVWAKALEIADGNSRRLVVESENSVLIRNRNSGQRGTD